MLAFPLRGSLVGLGASSRRHGCVFSVGVGNTWRFGCVEVFGMRNIGRLLVYLYMAAGVLCSSSLRWVGHHHTQRM
jgi:hypothetical protein